MVSREEYIKSVEYRLKESIPLFSVLKEVIKLNPEGLGGDDEKDFNKLKYGFAIPIVQSVEMLVDTLYSAPLNNDLYIYVEDKIQKMSTKLKAEVANNPELVEALGLWAKMKESQRTSNEDRYSTSDNTPLECTHDDPSTVKMNNIQASDCHRRFTCRFTCRACGETIKKHIEDDKDFIQKYNRSNDDRDLPEECNHNDPSTVWESSLQSLYNHKRYNCLVCQKTIKKHIENDKEFIQKYKDLRDDEHTEQYAYTRN